MGYFLAVVLLLNIAGLTYAVRSLRASSTKLSKLQSSSRKEMQELVKILRPELKKAQNQLNLAILEAPDFKNSHDWRFTLAVTSHPARFDALAQVLADLKNQILQPTTIVVTVAENYLDELPKSIQEMKSKGQIQVKSCHDLGPGKKLIPLLHHQELPIIVIDDDLILPPDLTLQLMIQHHLYPSAIIASRTHRVSCDRDGNLLPFSQWQKQTDDHDGPAKDLLATSGAGTLFPVGALHSDAVNEELYRTLTFHTDDLWWFVQARRNGTLVRRIPGTRPLEFIPESQEVGLWNTGNKDRNDGNLEKLIAHYGDIFRS